MIGALVVIATSCRSGGGGDKLPKLTPFAPELAERLHAIRDKASDVRGLPLNPHEQEGQISRDTLRAYTESETKPTAREQQQLESFNVAYRLMHLIGPNDDLLKLFSGSFSEGTLGFYVFSEHKLALVSDKSTIDPQDELVLAHEYIHSFQDSAFDLGRLQKLEKDEKENSRTEYDNTIRCLEEGDATVGEAKYGEAVYGPDWYKTVQAVSAGKDTGSETASIPPGIQRYISFDYNECASFVAALYADGGWDAVDKAYKDPPWTTEQILHPEKYKTRESVTNPAPNSLEDTLGKDWHRSDLDLFGEFDVYNYLASVLGNEPIAAVAAAGWGSGWIGIYANHSDPATPGGKVLVHLRLDWDTSQDFDEFLTVYAAAVDKVSNGHWTLKGTDGPVDWDGDNEHGSIRWNRALERVDIVISSDPDARDKVSATFQGNSR